MSSPLLTPSSLTLLMATSPSSSFHIGYYSNCPYFCLGFYWMADPMDCVNSQNCGQSVVLVLNSSLNPATGFYLDDILRPNHVRYHVRHDHAPIRCCCYYFVIRLGPAVSSLSCSALILDSKSPANHTYPHSRNRILMISMRAHAAGLSYPQAQCSVLPTVPQKKSRRKKKNGFSLEISNCTVTRWLENAHLKF